MPLPERAVVLLSGGLDSATCLLIARAAGREVFALSFDYGQRHALELERARALAARYGAVEHRVLRVDWPSPAASALTDVTRDVPKNRLGEDPIPATYVPARNTVFLALAVGYAESVGASDVFIGANALDYSGYPDCRPEFLEAFERAANLGTRAGALGESRLSHPRSPVADDERGDRREGCGIGPGFLPDPVLLRPRVARAAMRRMRCLPPPRKRLPRGRESPTNRQILDMNGLLLECFMLIFHIPLDLTVGYSANRICPSVDRRDVRREEGRSGCGSTS